MRTPRPAARAAVTKPGRGISTLIGNGWLHEAPKNLWPKAWDIRGRSALRKCMFLPEPDARALAAMPVPFAPPGARLPFAPPGERRNGAAAPCPPPPYRQGVSRPEPIIAAPRRDPQKHARIMPAVDPRALRPVPTAAAAWYEDPVALGTLLIFAPPIGLAALWASKRYTSDARWALTVMTGLTMCLCTAIALALALK